MKCWQNTVKPSTTMDPYKYEEALKNDGLPSGPEEVPIQPPASTVQEGTEEQHPISLTGGDVLIARKTIAAAIDVIRKLHDKAPDTADDQTYALFIASALEQVAASIERQAALAFTAVPMDVMADIISLVNYVIETEQENYNERSDEERPGHIYDFAKRISDWMNQ